MQQTALGTAWRELRARPRRSLATAMGVVVATAAAVAGASLAAASERGLSAEAAAGGRGLWVLAAAPERSGAARASLLAPAFDADDVEALRREVTGIERLAPASSLRALASTAPNRSHRTLVLGTTPEYFALREQQLGRGRWMTQEEVAAAAPVCVVGPALVAAVFAGADPLQGSVRVGTLSCSVIGVLAPREPAADSDDILAMPLSTLQRSVLGSPAISAVYFAARADHPAIVVAHQVDALLRERRRIAPSATADFSVRAARDLIPARSGAAEYLPPALAGAAGAAFLLAALGLMLWLRARSREQRRPAADAPGGGGSALSLLLEAMLLSVGGGVVGATLGLGLGFAATHLAGFAFGVPVIPVLVALVAALLLGLACGAPLALTAGARAPNGARARD